MSRQLNQLYEFGEFQLDAAERVLRQGEKPVPLTPKAFETLLVLVRRGGHLVEKDELMKQVWADTIVEEANLARNIWTLRKALGDDEREHRYIETVPKLGYRFVAPVTELPNEGIDVLVRRQVRARIVTEEEDSSDRSRSAIRVEENAHADSEILPPYSSAQTFLAPGAKASWWSKRNAVSLLIAVAVCASIAALTAMIISRSHLSETADAIDSVAVLPFVNVNNDPNTEYLSDGISDSIINSLSRLPALRVMSLNSVLRYKGKQVDPQAIGRELNVRAVLMGRLTKQGDSLVISTELVDVRDNRRLWGEQYNRKLSDIIVVQTEIAREISDNLRLRLSSQDKKQLAKRYTENNEAYQLYLNGLFYERKDFKKAVDYYERAIGLDPNFAQAYAGSAMAYVLLVEGSGVDPKEAMPKAKAAAQKALDLDETLADAHGVLAVIKRDELDWAGAESEFKRTFMLNPNYAARCAGYANFLSEVGRQTEALAEIKKAQELDPFRIGYRVNEGDILRDARRYDEAIQELQNAIEMQSDNAGAHASLGYTYAAKGMYAEAIAEYQKSISMDREYTDDPVFMGYAYAMSGKRNEALACLNKLRTTKEYVSPAELAVLYTGLGDKEEALNALERAYAEHDSQLRFLKVDAHYDSLRSDPRFQDLLRRVGFPH